MGLDTPSVGPQIAECQKVLEKSGLEYKVCRLHTYEVIDDTDDIDAVSHLLNVEIMADRLAGMVRI
jgi:uncharacterized protein YqgV (UPF0045/DUF77 family)